MNTRKYASLGLAVALQVLPLTRVFVATTPAMGSSYAIIATWIAGALALMGGVDSVSGASSIAIGPVSGTTGVPYSGVVQYSGGHSSGVRSWELRNRWTGAVSGCNTIYEIAPGLWLTNSGNYIAKIGGTPTTPGTYTFTVRVWSGSGCSGGDNDSRSATITIVAGGGATAPAITTHPTSQTVTAGANVNFTVAASGTAPLSYRWRLNGANISGATAATLTLNSVTVGQSGGSYSCVVSNSAGTATSGAATLTVNPAVVAPTITTHPTSQTVTAGANVNFTVAASGTAPLGYQWRLNGGNISGATAATLTLNSVTVGQSGGSYSCVVSNSAGTATSGAATLTVNPAVVAPTITTHPTSQTVTAGANVNFTVAASGTAPLSYRWRLNGANISGATAATLTLNSVTVGQSGGSYSCVVSNSAGTATSSAATLTVNPAVVAPTITTPPANQSALAGANVSFNVVAAGTAPLSYQWRLNNTNIPSATSSTLTLTGVTLGQTGGSYSCVVTNLAGSVTSSAAILTVSVATIAPAVTTHPTSQTVTAGANVNFTVAASGTAPLGYQWRLNGGNIVGATAANLTLNSVTVGQSGGSYSCVVSNSAGTATSGAATLTVNPAVVAPTITTHPTSQTVTAGANVSFTVAASGTAPLAYQWRLNGGNIVGATAANLTLNSVTVGQSGGSYSCVVSNSAGTATSTAATLTVNSAVVAPTITTHPTSQTVTAGANVSFTVAASGTAPLSYQWRLNGGNIVGATTATLTLNSVTVGQSGSSYSCVVSNSAGTATSTAATLTVNSAVVAPTITTHPTSQTVTAGANVSFTVAASGTAPLSYQWRLNGGNIVGATTATLTLNSVTVGQSGSSYSCVVSNSAGTATSTAATLTVSDVTQTASIAGVYNGLFYENDAVRLHSAGQFSLALNENKIFTAWLQIGGTRYSMIGTFNSALTATSVIVRSGANSLSVELRVGQGAEAGQIFGRVTDGVWSSPLSGGRSVSPSPFAGNYTLVIPGTAGNAALPAGDGYATLHVASDGLATMNGVLADGARFSQSAYVTEDGDWPLFAAIYSGKGVIASWIAFANLSTSDLNGTLVWIKEAGTSTTSFPLGFTNSVNSIGSFYVAPSAGNKALNLSGAVVNFSGGSLGSGFNNVVSVNANSQVVNLSPNEMVMTVMNAVGSFTGQVREPGTGALHMYGGVVLQKQNAGYGTMTGVPTGSRVIFAAP